MLCDVFKGEHHLPGKIRACGDGIEINAHGGMSTYDFDFLTRLVMFAHDRCIRVEVGSSGPRLVKLLLHRRHTRDGNIVESHPTMEKALEKHREAWPLE
jgi:hypothetical protein